MKKAIDKNFLIGCAVSLAAIGVVGYAVKETKSPWCLLGLLLIPTCRTSSSDGNDKNEPREDLK